MTDSLGQEGFAEVDVHTESPPVPGRVEVEPRNGRPLATIFALRGLDWVVENGDGPLAYRLGFRYQCSNQNEASRTEWLTGISQDNEFSFALPSIDSELDPELLLQVFDRKGAVYDFTHSFSLLEVSGDFEVAQNSSFSSLLDLVGAINTSVTSGHWMEGLAWLSSLVTSLDVDHTSVICSADTQTSLSPQFQLSNSEFVDLKMRALQIVLSLYESFVPASQSHHQVVLSLLEKVSRVHCSSNESSSLAQPDLPRLLGALEEMVDAATNFSEFGVLSRRGMSREDAEAVLNIYKQVLYASTLIDREALPLARANSSAVAASLQRTLPQLGLALCQRQRIFQDGVTIDLGSFLNIKSSHINLPSDYTAGGCSGERCSFDPVMVDFGSELFASFLQRPCSSDGNSSEGCCSGLCVSSTQLYLNPLWSGSPFLSLLRTPLLHLSLLDASDGAAVGGPMSTSPPTLIFPLLSRPSDRGDLYCVVWEETSLSWTNTSCDTDVFLSTSCVRCQCSDIGSLFYAVLERCPDGHYGENCNQSESCCQELSQINPSISSHCD